MKKIISILALVLAITALLSVAAFAEDAAPAKTFALAEDYVENAAVTVVPATDSIAVTLNAAVTGADYSILLVSGDALPTADSSIAYINQDDAESASLAFSVLPKLTSCTDDMTIYIGSNATGAQLISIPVTYKAVAVEPPAPTYQLAEIDGDGSPASIGDALAIISFANWEPGVLDAYVEDFEALTAMAEIDGDGSPASIGDAMEIISFANWEPSALDSIYGF